MTEVIKVTSEHIPEDEAVSFCMTDTRQGRSRELFKGHKALAWILAVAHLGRNPDHQVVYMEGEDD